MDGGCYHLACSGGLFLCGIEVQQRLGQGEDDKVTSVSLEREAAKDSLDSLREGLVKEFRCYLKNSCR